MMTHEQFCWWLKGYLSHPETLTQSEITTIKEMLAKVLDELPFPIDKPVLSFTQNSSPWR